MDECLPTLIHFYDREFSLRMLKVFDGNLVVRQRLETDPTGYVIRNLWIESRNAKDDVHLWVFDNPTGNSLRRKLYPEYKLTRKPPNDDIRQFMELWKSVVKLTPALSITVPGYEADDVIAHVAAQFPCEIISRDADLRQLEMYPGVKVKTDSLKSIPPELIRLYKASVGDPSDNIKGIPGFGKATFENCDKDALRNFYQGGQVPTDLPQRCQNALAADPEHYRMIWKIVTFFPIPNELVDSNLVQGKDMPDKVEAILKELLM